MYTNDLTLLTGGRLDTYISIDIGTLLSNDGFEGIIPLRNEFKIIKTNKLYILLYYFELKAFSKSALVK